jgi:hypothetical protein
VGRVQRDSSIAQNLCALLANQQRIQRDVGYGLLSTEGYETVDEVVFAEPGDMSILGVRTLEGFGVMVDNTGHRFVANPTTVARETHSDNRTDSSSTLITDFMPDVAGLSTHSQQGVQFS